MLILGCADVLLNVCTYSALKGVDTWRQDTIEYFGNWDECWARITGALVDKDGKEIHKSL